MPSLIPLEGTSLPLGAIREKLGCGRLRQEIVSGISNMTDRHNRGLLPIEFPRVDVP